MVNKHDDVIIIGSGPAGLSAAIYAARLGMKTRVFESSVLGGRASEAPEVWNFPGFPEGINGFELINRMAQQAQKFGAKLLYPEEVLNLTLNDTVKTMTTRSSNYHCLAVIIATGTQRKKLLVPGETEFLGRGVSYCAVCDGPLFRDRIVAVVGSGNEAFEDAMYLSNFSKKVFLILHSEEIKAEKALVDECKERSNIEIFKAKVESILGEDFVTVVKNINFKDSKETHMPIDGVFISVGGVPMTNLVKAAGIEVDKNGCIKVDRRQGTSIEGVYAAGDCTCGGMQIITAAGEGAMAAIQAYRYVKKTGK
jgi:thioredoxin reductase (NADPH)